MKSSSVFDRIASFQPRKPGCRERIVHLGERLPARQRLREPVLRRRPVRRAGASPPSAPAGSSTSRRVRAPVRPRGSARAARRRAPRRRHAQARRECPRSSRSACRSSRSSPSDPSSLRYAAASSCGGRYARISQPCASSHARRLAIRRPARLDEAPERGTVVVLDQVTHLVHDDVVEHVVRGEHEPPVEAQRAARGARSPAADLIAERDARGRRHRAPPPPTGRAARSAPAPRGGPARP